MSLTRPAPRRGIAFVPRAADAFKPKGTTIKRLLIAAGLVAALATSPAALAAGTLTGKYKAKIKGDATYTLTFKTGGRYTIARNGKTFVQATDSVKGTTITLNPKTHNPACSTSGTYRFKLSGKTLKFTRIHDSCARRSVVLAHTFTHLG